MVGVLLPHALEVAETAKRLGVAEAAKRLEAGLEAAAGVLNQIGRYRLARAALAEAEPLMKRALAVWEKALGPAHPDTATDLHTLATLATLYQDQGRLGEAEALYRQALAIREKALGPEHSQTCKVRENLATLRESLSARPPDGPPTATRPPGTAP